jgi:hypothetical protein
LVEGDLAGLLGSFIPFAQTKAQRIKSRDPRLSIEERYKNQNEYMQQISHAARGLLEKRFLLQEDADRIIAEAAKAQIFAAK